MGYFTIMLLPYISNSVEQTLLQLLVGTIDCSWIVHLPTSSTAGDDDASQAGRPSQGRDPEAMAEARVDIRKLQQFLMGQQVNPSKAMCSKSPQSWHAAGRHLVLHWVITHPLVPSDIIHQRVVHLILLHEDVSLQYFIPAVA